MELTGHLRRWNGTWGIIFTPAGGPRYFLHRSNVRSAENIKDGARVAFEPGPARSAGDLPVALNAYVVPEPVQVRP